MPTPQIAFLCKNWIVVLYFALCMGLVAKAELDCMNAHELGILFCSLTEYAILSWLLIPTQWLMVAMGAPIYDLLYEITPHAELSMLILAVLLNTAVLYFALRGVRELIGKLRKRS